MGNLRAFARPVLSTAIGGDGVIRHDDITFVPPWRSAEARLPIKLAHSFKRSGSYRFASGPEVTSTGGLRIRGSGSCCPKPVRYRLCLSLGFPSAMKSAIAMLCVSVVLLPITVRCSSVMARSRRSGISDQRLAELETLAGLKSLQSRFRTGLGIIDPSKIGKRKRSFESLEELQRSMEDQRAADEDIFTGLPAAGIVGRMRHFVDHVQRR